MDLHLEAVQHRHSASRLASCSNLKIGLLCWFLAPFTITRKPTAPDPQIYLAAEDVGPIFGIAFIICTQATLLRFELPTICCKRVCRYLVANPWKQGGAELGMTLGQKRAEPFPGELQVTSTDGWTKLTYEFSSPPDGETRS